MVNEGAVKGILITTSDHGADAYQFAKDKPLSLLNGGDLLHLLQEHGYKAKIDIDAAEKPIAHRIPTPAFLAYIANTVSPLWARTGNDP